MRYLRTASTRRLLAAVAGLVVAAVAGTAIAIAATSAGPVPKRTSLANAIHHALAGPSVAGVTARVTFTNHLIDSGDLQGTDPLLSGATGRMWLSPGHGIRLELQSQSGTDAQIVVNRKGFWAYDPMTNTVYRGALPAGSRASHPPDSHAASGVPTIADIQSAIAKLAGRVLVSGAIPGDVAGRATYTVKLAPADAGGRLSRIEVSWDAANAVPLSVAVFARGDSTPVLGLTASSIGYGRVPASTFNLRVPGGAKVVDVSLPAQAAPSAPTKGAHAKGEHAEHAAVTGAAAVAKKVRFALDAPATADGHTLTGVRLIGKGADAGALLSYGQGLGGVYVIERQAAGKGTGKPAAVTAPSGNQPGLTLPSVTVRGATAQELDTALGSVLTFRRGGVSFTVLGSVQPSAVKAVAGAL